MALKLKDVLYAKTNTRFNIIAFKKEAKGREFVADDIVAIRRYNIVKESTEEGYERISWCYKYGDADVEFLTANRYGELDITIFVEDK